MYDGHRSRAPVSSVYALQSCVVPGEVNSCADWKRGDYLAGFGVQYDKLLVAASHEQSMVVGVKRQSGRLLPRRGLVPCDDRVFIRINDHNFAGVLEVLIDDPGLWVGLTVLGEAAQWNGLAFLGRDVDQSYAAALVI